MNPFYFGESARPLFGAFHPARVAAGEGEAPAVLLCYPIGSEYLRAHRAFRQLTSLLTRAGCAVLRFDYFGSGDSAGDAEEATVEAWLANVGAAIDELKDAAGVPRVSLAGLRFGAMLAAVAVRDRDDVDAIVLWDPFLSGPACLAAMGIGGELADRGEVVGSGGFAVSPALRRGIAALGLGEGTPAEGPETHVVVSAPDAEAEGLARRWRDGGRAASYACVPSEGDWAKGDRFGSALIPQAIIQEVVRRLTRGAGA